MVPYAYFFRLGVEWHFIPVGIKCPIHSFRNEIVIPFWQEWNGLIPFLLEWNCFHSIPTGIECNHSISSGMKYTFHSCSHCRKFSLLWGKNNMWLCIPLCSIFWGETITEVNNKRTHFGVCLYITIDSVKTVTSKYVICVKMHLRN